jgi:hypothetical protein
LKKWLYRRQKRRSNGGKPSRAAVNLQHGNRYDPFGPVGLFYLFGAAAGRRHRFDLLDAREQVRAEYADLDHPRGLCSADAADAVCAVGGDDDALPLLVDRLPLNKCASRPGGQEAASINRETHPECPGQDFLQQNIFFYLHGSQSSAEAV